MLLTASLDIKTCLDSAECVIGTVLSAGIPGFVVLFALLYVVGLRLPKWPIFTEFITQEDVDEVLTKKDPRTTDIPSEQTPLLFTQSSPPVRPKLWRQIALTLLGAAESAGWAYALVLYTLNSRTLGSFSVFTTTLSLASRVYSMLRPSLKPSCTPYYDLFTIYGAHFLATCFRAYQLVWREDEFGIARLITLLAKVTPPPHWLHQT
ncbi:hypothetical protein FRC09_014649 [Ceratobasidium sp. 395]|nr:hypothetical protein FRC09_014649 [Ceratobasidium sp. 395]